MFISKIREQINEFVFNCDQNGHVRLVEMLIKDYRASVDVLSLVCLLSRNIL